MWSSAQTNRRGQSELDRGARAGLCPRVPRCERRRSVGWRATLGFPRACRRLSFLPGCLALSRFCRAEGSGGGEELLAGAVLHYEGEMRSGPVREAECLPGDAESGDEFIGLSLSDVPSSGFSDSLSDLNTH